jgi:hypothetical protein
MRDHFERLDVLGRDVRAEPLHGLGSKGAPGLLALVSRQTLSPSLSHDGTAKNSMQLPRRHREPQLI